MMSRHLLFPFLFFVCALLSCGFFSCTSTKRIKYFQNIPDSGRLSQIGKADYIEPKIQDDDILTVIIQTVDPQSVALINAGNVSGGGNSAAPSQLTAAALPVPTQVPSAQLGYLVDVDGNITIPVIGKVKVAGLSLEEAKKAIFDITDQYYKDASVVVSFANFRVNVAGEVLRPGTYVMPNEKVTILDALSLAGDLTIFGKRDNVLLIRQNPDGTKTPYRINLTKTDFMTSPGYYLKQNDYIYVEPLKSKVASTDAAQGRNIAIFGSILSVLIILLTRVK